jgi:hypothetical protein
MLMKHIHVLHPFGVALQLYKSAILPICR